jgi:hypothetical protein
MPAHIRTNPDESLIELETPEGIVFGPLGMPKDEDGEPAEPIFLVDEDNPGGPAYIATVSAYEGLEPNCVYQLVKVVTEVETGVDLEEDDDDDDDDDGILVGAGV